MLARARLVHVRAFRSHPLQRYPVDFFNLILFAHTLMIRPPPARFLLIGIENGRLAGTPFRKANCCNMRILLVGGGGREHALAWKLRQSAQCNELFAAPGNGGIESVAECLPIGSTEIAALVQFARQEAVDLVVCGPESPLIAGLANACQEWSIPCFGPLASGARLEGSKAFAKSLMAESAVPTAAFAVFEDPAAAGDYLRQHFASQRCVVKADGEAMGKGVFVCETLTDALDAVEFLMVQQGQGEAGKRIVIEDRLHGPEISFMGFTDGERFLPLPPSRDFKRAFEGDRGPNTGGMGCVAPVLDATPELLQQALERCTLPILRALDSQGTRYRGALYTGLLVHDSLPHTLEYNCRFGDPETQALMPLMQGDLVELTAACATQSLKGMSLEASRQSAVCVVLASGGYPGDYRRGLPIEGLERAQQEPDVLIFHAGTKRMNGSFVTAGGRVLNVVGLGSSIVEARERAYRAVEQIHFEGMHYRADIGAGL